MSRKIDLCGTQFGRLTVLYRHDKRDTTNGRSYWVCRCSCGEETVVHQSNLKSGRTTSCGCLRKETATRNSTKHGGYYSRLYRIWSNMMTRCYNPNHGCYEHYGNRGISVCPDWHKFENFQQWAVSNGYEGALTLERVDSASNYEPQNCRWATMKEQENNTRRNVRITINGITRTLSEWADLAELPYSLVWKRVRLRKWPIEKALNTPPLR